MDKEKALKLIAAEYDRAVAKFPKFNSGHEGYAVIKEELDELWLAIKGDHLEHLKQDEAIQIGAMAVRFLTDL